MIRIFLSIAFVLVGLVSFAADYSTYSLDNGQNVVIKEVHDNPIVIIDTWIKTGSINETDENNGVAHFLEHYFLREPRNILLKNLIEFLNQKVQLQMLRQARILLIIIF